MKNNVMFVYNAYRSFIILIITTILLILGLFIITHNFIRNTSYTTPITTQWSADSSWVKGGWQ